MENAISAALSRQIVLTRALDVTANNIANQSTPGFKAERAAFEEFLAPTDRTNNALSAEDPFISLVIDPASFTDFSAGGLEPTGGDFDFAIDGDGFFAVQTSVGVQYTRDGRFTVNGFGELTTQTGAPVLDDGGSAILLDAQAGPVLSTPEGDLQQNGSIIARLGVFEAADRNALRKEGGNFFSAPSDLPTADSPRVVRGFTETSNVAPVQSVTEMIGIMRAYQQASEVASAADDLSREAIRRLSDIN